MTFPVDIIAMFLFLLFLQYALQRVWLWMDSDPFPPEKIESAVTFGVMIVQAGGIGIFGLYALMRLELWDQIWWLIFIPLPFYLVAAWPHYRAQAKRRDESKVKIEKLNNEH